MSVQIKAYQHIQQELQAKGVQLVAVSKTKPIKDIMELYALGHRDFGENYVQELIEKHEALPKDIRWHFIGHLQSNKVKYIAPFVHLIHGVDSLKLAKEIHKQGAKLNRVIDCLFQVFIAQEETKFGMDAIELAAAIQETGSFNYIRIRGLMGMASFTNDQQQLQKEFGYLKELFNKYVINTPHFDTLSMGMSADYTTAIASGSNLVRIGSLLFGERSII